MGIIFYMVLFDEYPFQGDGEILTKNIIENKWKLPEDKYEPDKKIISSKAVDLLKRMLTSNPKEWIWIVDIEAHPWFDMDW